jgi:tetratricopeptide (TPR) repeat protein
MISSLITSTILALALQVGPDPTATDRLGVPDELLNRPERPGQDDGLPASPESEWLAQCLAMLPDNAARAHSLAQVKRNESAGAERVLANHCLGLAATQLGLWEDAVAAFSAARDGSPAEDLRLRARFGAMAGNAALAGGDAARATAILSSAREDAVVSASAPLQAIAATDLARALVAQQRPDDALAELETAIALQPEAPEAWLLKATLLRRLDRLDEAQVAIERAGQLAPLDAMVGLEAGVIAVLAGREEAARASWQSVIDLEPSSPAALTAQDYIAQLGPAPEAAAEPTDLPEEPS